MDSDILNPLVTTPIGVPNNSTSLEWAPRRSLGQRYRRLRSNWRRYSVFVHRKDALHGVAVRAALEARDYLRAEELARRFASEDGTPESLRAAIDEIFQEDAGSPRSGSRTPRSVTRSRGSRSARLIRDTGEFGLGV